MIILYIIIITAILIPFLYLTKSESKESKILSLRRDLDKLGLSATISPDGLVTLVNSEFDNKISVKKSKWDEYRSIYYTDYEDEYQQMDRILPYGFRLDNLSSISIIHSKLSSFDGFPKSVYSVNVQNNYLKSFEGCPQYVSYLDVSHNNITNFYHVPHSINLNNLNCQFNPINNLKEILKKLIHQNTPNLLNIFNDYNCWSHANKLLIDGDTFRDIIYTNFDPEIEIDWIPYELTWNRNNFYYNIIAIDRDFESRSNTRFEQGPGKPYPIVCWDVISQLSGNSYENVKGFLVIKKGNDIIYCPSIYNFIFS